MLLLFLLEFYCGNFAPLLGGLISLSGGRNPDILPSGSVWALTVEGQLPLGPTVSLWCVAPLMSRKPLQSRRYGILVNGASCSLPYVSSSQRGRDCELFQRQSLPCSQPQRPAREADVGCPCGFSRSAGSSPRMLLPSQTRALSGPRGDPIHRKGPSQAFLSPPACALARFVPPSWKERRPCCSPLLLTTPHLLGFWLFTSFVENGVCICIYLFLLFALCT